MLVAEESLIRSLVKIYGKHIAYSDRWMDGGTWYPEACVSLGLKHRRHSFVLRKKYYWKGDWWSM